MKLYTTAWLTKSSRLWAIICHCFVFCAHLTVYLYGTHVVCARRYLPIDFVYLNYFGNNFIFFPIDLFTLFGFYSLHDFDVSIWDFFFSIFYTNFNLTKWTKSGSKIRKTTSNEATTCCYYFMFVRIIFCVCILLFWFPHTRTTHSSLISYGQRRLAWGKTLWAGLLWWIHSARLGLFLMFLHCASIWYF